MALKRLPGSDITIHRRLTVRKFTRSCFCSSSSSSYGWKQQRGLTRGAACTDDDVGDQLAALSAADIFEAQGKRGQVCPSIAPLWRPMSLAGPAFTIRQRECCEPPHFVERRRSASDGAGWRAGWLVDCAGWCAAAGDNLGVHHALAKPSSTGCVLVVEVGGADNAEVCSTALVGDVIAHAAKLRGVRGLVTNGRVRDYDKLRQIGFPVYCTGLNINGPEKRMEGEQSVVIELGGAVIAPGDFIVGDSDGLVVVAQEEAANTLSAAEARMWAEVAILARLDAGDTTLSIYKQ
jgi:4-hydroxy-4-methyl-2-oxoglutarate aldolase